MEEAMDSDDEMEEEAVIASVSDDEHLIMLSCLMAMYARDGAKLRRGVQRQDAARASRCRGWRPIAFSTSTTHCRARWYFEAISG
jgi:hypothetical protein